MPWDEFGNYIPDDLVLNMEYKMEYKPEPQPMSAKLEAEIERGVYDDRTLQLAIKSYSLRSVSSFLSSHAISIQECNSCDGWVFCRNLKSAYCGAYFVCGRCQSNYVYCSGCSSLRLVADSVAHFHGADLRKRKADNTIQRFDANVFELLGRAFFITNEDKSPRYRKTPLYLGVELEVERDGRVTPPDMILKATSVLGNGRFAIAKHDGSLQAAPGTDVRGTNGFEVVTLPATKKYHLREAGWQKFFHALQPFTQQRPATAGLHFHVNSAYLTRATIGKLVKFINDPTNTPFLRMVADRDFTAPNPVTGRVYAPVFTNLMERVSDVVSKRTHLPNCPMAPSSRSLRRYYLDGSSLQIDYYGHPKIATLNGQTAVKTCNCPDGHYSYRDHYAAINLKTKHPTVEFRIFQASMNVDHFFASMDFCVALIAFCEDTGFGNLNYREFINWFNVARPHHPHLAKWLVLCGYIAAPKGKK